jgi:beta-galactosidase/beta-glucuronidase
MRGAQARSCVVVKMSGLACFTVLVLELCTISTATGAASVDITSGNPAAELRDLPPVGQSLRYLDGVWSASSSGGSTGLEHTINASVPGDIISDLEAAGLIGDPWFETNWRDDAGMWFRKWRYSTTFVLSLAEAEQLRAGAEVFVVFDGIKMGATIELDGHVVGVATDQWLRYSFPISKMLSPAASHELSVTFDNAINTHGRYMGCSGGWGPRDRLSHCQLTPIHLWGCKED